MEKIWPRTYKLLFFQAIYTEQFSTLNLNMLQHVFNIKIALSLPLKSLLINNALEYNA